MAIKQAVLAFMANELVDKVVFQQDFMDASVLKQSAIVGGLQFFSGTLVNNVTPFLPTVLRVSDQYSKPVMVGVSYVLIEYFMKDDSRSMLYQFLASAGSSYLALMAEPIVNSVLPNSPLLN